MTTRGALGRTVRTGLTLGFLSWAAAFVVRSSVPGIDGRRYFCLYDDAMVSMRYAANLAGGAGLVWNPGERVEGYTNPLWTLLMSAAVRLCGWRFAPLAMQLAGIVILLATAAVAARLARDVAPSESIAPTLAFAFVLAHYPLVYWTLMGMETGLVLLLWYLAAATAFSNEDDDRPSLRLAVLLGLAYLTRPDTLVTAGLLLLHRARTTRRYAVAAWETVGLAAFVLAHLTWRLAYYGTLLPNTYRLKVEGMPLAFRIANGLAFVGPWVLATLPLFVLAARAAHDRRSRLLLVTAAALVAYQIWVGGDFSDHWRFLCAAPVILAPIALRGGRLWSEMLAPRLSAAYGPRATTGIVILALAAAGAHFLREQAFLGPTSGVSQNRDSVNVALVLRRVLEPDATLAVFWAGAIPYYTRQRAFDLLGKSDARTAGLAPDLSGAVSWSRMKSVPGHNKYDLRHTIVGRQPTFLEHDAWGREDQSRYVRQRYVALNTPFGRLLLLKDSPAVRWHLLGMKAPGSS